MKSLTSLTFKSQSPKETKKIGRRIGLLLKSGDVVALTGDLGAGKTTLVKGIAKGLEVFGEDEVVSPSFVLIHEYEGREKIYHIDWYRLKSIEGADALLADECFKSGGVTLVEWAERGKNILPSEHVRVHLQHKGPQWRTIQVSVKGKGHGDFLGLLNRKP